MDGLTIAQFIDFALDGGLTVFALLLFYDERRDRKAAQLAQIEDAKEEANTWRDLLKRAKGLGDG